MYYLSQFRNSWKQQTVLGEKEIYLLQPVSDEIGIHQVESLHSMPNFLQWDMGITRVTAFVGIGNLMFFNYLLKETWKVATKVDFQRDINNCLHRPTINEHLKNKL